MNQADVQRLFQYNQWANGRILAQVIQVTPEQFLAPASFPHGGLRSTLVHTLFAEWIWRTRWAGSSPTERLRPEDFPTAVDLQTRWAQEDAALMDFVAQVSDEQLNGPFQYRSTKGEPRQNILWHSMLHMVNHSTQHRAEAAALLTDFGHSPGDLDMIYYLTD